MLFLVVVLFAESELPENGVYEIISPVYFGGVVLEYKLLRVEVDSNSGRIIWTEDLNDDGFLAANEVKVHSATFIETSVFWGGQGILNFFAYQPTTRLYEWALIGGGNVLVAHFMQIKTY